VSNRSLVDVGEHMPGDEMRPQEWGPRVGKELAVFRQVSWRRG
jgi:hypothetical protein